MENEVLKTIKERRSVRSFKSDPVPRDLLNSILEAGTFAPTGGGRQSPVIIDVSSDKYRKKISEFNAKVMSSKSDPYYGAATIFLVLAEGTASTFVEDGS